MPIVEFEKRGAIAEIRLNRPDKLNAVNATMLEELGAALSEAQNDHDARVIMLLGNGKEILLQGGSDIDAAHALAIGLINRVVAAPDLMVEARKLATEIAMNDPLAVRLTKKAVNHCVEITGMRDALLAALETDIEIETTEPPESQAFNEILASDGLKAALAWRAAQTPGSSRS